MFVGVVVCFTHPSHSFSIVTHLVNSIQSFATTTLILDDY